MIGTHIKVRSLYALRVDASGRVGRLRVIGDADRADLGIGVEACVAQLDPKDPKAWQNQGVSSYARMVDPTRTLVAGHENKFGRPELANPAERVFVAELDVLASPAVPPFLIGRQSVPINIRVRYTVPGGTYEPTLTFAEIEPTAEFDVGVLFVHGIGKQRRAETLAQWSAPLLRWINAWLDGASDEVASRLQGTSLDDWLFGMSVLKSTSQVDPDYVDRAGYARNLARKALAPRVKLRDELMSLMPRNAPADEPGGKAPEKETDSATVVATIKNDIQAEAVGGSAEFREAYVLDVGTRSVDPSSVEMHVEAMAADGYMLRSRWMLAESHWAESFWAPSFFGFGRWCLLTAPVLLVHYIKLAWLRHPSWLMRIPSAVALTFAVALAQFAFLLLTLLWLVPWQRLRADVLRVQIGLAGVVGDSYILLEDPVQRRAILDRVSRNLEWLVQRCRSVVLIAHSQGAAVAEQVLSQREQTTPERVTYGATLGAGIQTLDAIRDLSRKRLANAVGWTAILCALLVGVAAITALMGAPTVATWIAIVAVLGLLIAAVVAWTAHPGRLAILPKAARDRPWFDFYARKDLVPFGPLVDAANNGATYKPKEVRNQNSYIADHVTYWQNPEQVVGPLARLIGDAAGFKPVAKLLPNDDVTMAALEGARLSRLGFLRVARLVLLAASAWLLYEQRAAWFSIGFWAVVWVQSKFGLALGAVRAPALHVWLDALVVFVPLLVHKTLVNSTFDGWTTAEVERLLRRSAGKPATHWAMIFSTLLVLVAIGTIAFVWQARWQHVWPLSALNVAAVTVIAAIVFAGVARNAHARRINNAVTGFLAAKKPA